MTSNFPAARALSALLRNVMKPLCFIALLGALLAQPAFSQSDQSGYWRSRDGKPIAETESMKSKDGFAGSLLATTDEDWEKKWNTPPETAPNFNMAGTVAYGKKVFALIFFANPKRDAQGKANVTCDIQLSSPEGKVSFSRKDMACYSGPIGDNPYNLYLSAPVVAFSGDPGDPPGIWAVEVMLRDAQRGVALPLRTTFILKE